MIHRPPLSAGFDFSHFSGPVRMRIKFIFRFGLLRNTPLALSGERGIF
jgi:hypothetical protein